MILYSVISIIFGVGCILSTVFIKQHYFIDMVFGVIFMVVFYSLVVYFDKKLLKKKELKNKA